MGNKFYQNVQQFVGGLVILRENKLSTKVYKFIGTFSVVLVYVPRTERKLQTVFGGIQDGIHIQLYSIIGGRENILLVKDSM